MQRLFLCAAAVLLMTHGVQADERKPASGVRQDGTASYYRGGQDGNSKTATGEKVDPGAKAAASRDLPLGTEATVTNRKTGRSTDVRINDRGPARPDRTIDLSEKAAKDIGMDKTGTAPVTVEARPDRQKDPQVRRKLEQVGETPSRGGGQQRQ